jgi:predicted SprT family Zn-dependent metalloprotease
MLNELFQRLNQEHFNGSLPPPDLLWNSRLSSAAGRFTPGSRSTGKRPLIEIASYLRDLSDGPTHVRATLLHEMVHYLLWHQRRPHGHTGEFKKILKSVGAPRYNPVPRLRPPKYSYICGNCQTTVLARRKLGTVACALCCKKLNGGRFHRNFLLELQTLPLNPVSGEGLHSRPTALPLSQKRTASEEVPLQPDDLISRIQAMRDWLKERTKGKSLY